MQFVHSTGKKFFFLFINYDLPQPISVQELISLTAVRDSDFFFVPCLQQTEYRFWPSYPHLPHCIHYWRPSRLSFGVSRTSNGATKASGKAAKEQT